MDEFATTALHAPAVHANRHEGGDGLGAAILHGGDLTAARRIYGGKAGIGWISPPASIRDPIHWSLFFRAYRAKTGAGFLKPMPTTICLPRRIGTTPMGSDACGDVVAAPGSEALVQLVPLLLPRSRVVVLGPCYDGHASAWRAVGHMVAEAPSLPAVTPGLVVIVVNPNNPDGRIFDVETLVHYGRSLADRGGLLVVDEAFADLAPEYSLVPRAGQCGVLVLRSFGKFFGLAGLRLGFAFGARQGGRAASHRSRRLAGFCAGAGSGNGGVVRSRLDRTDAGLPGLRAGLRSIRCCAITTSRLSEAPTCSA